jgi:hypothetical protein
MIGPVVRSPPRFQVPTDYSFHLFGHSVKPFVSIYSLHTTTRILRLKLTPKVLGWASVVRLFSSTWILRPKLKVLSCGPVVRVLLFSSASEDLPSSEYLWEHVPMTGVEATRDGCWLTTCLELINSTPPTHVSARTTEREIQQSCSNASGSWNPVKSAMDKEFRQERENER